MTTDTTPRWVKVFAGIAILLALLFIISHLAGWRGGGHSRGGHSGGPPPTSGAAVPEGTA